MHKRTGVAAALLVLLWSPVQVRGQHDIAGKVLLPDGTPAEGARVHLMQVREPWAEEADFSPLLAGARTGARGTYSLQIEHAAAGEDVLSFLLVARREGSGIDWTRLGDLSVRPKTLRLRKPGTVAGTVTDDTGSPIAGARVYPVLIRNIFEGEEGILFPPWQESLLSTRTGPNGRFAFDWIPRDCSAEFLVSAPGRVRTDTLASDGRMWGQYKPGQTDVRIELPPESRVEGTVLNAATKRPVEGARVVASRIHSGQRFGPVPTDTDGRFSLGRLAAGDYRLLAARGDADERPWLSPPVRVSAETGRTVTGKLLRLSPAGVIEVKVVQQGTGREIEGAQVEMNALDGSDLMPGLTDPNGVARFVLWPGKYRVGRVTGLSRYGPNAERPHLEVAGRKVARAEVSIPALPEFRGQLVGPDGSPLAGAEVLAVPSARPDLRRTTTDPRGRFRLPLPPVPVYSGEPTLLFLRHKQRGLGKVLALPDRARDLGKLAAVPAATVAGRVVDPNGNGVPRARVALLCGRTWMWSTMDWTNTLPDGRYDFSAVPPGRSYTVQVRAGGAFGPGEVEVAAPAEPDETVQVEDIVVRPATLSVSGRAVDPNGRAWDGAEVTAAGPGQPFVYTRTDEGGRFVLEGLCAGELTVHASAPPVSLPGGMVAIPAFAAREAEAGSTDVRIVMEREESGGAGDDAPMSRRCVKYMRLPSLVPFQLGHPTTFADGRRLLICFWSATNSASRQAVRQLEGRAGALAKRGIVTVTVHDGPMGREKLTDWEDRLGLTLPTGLVGPDEAQAGRLRERWNVSRLPWMVLTDELHHVEQMGSSLLEIGLSGDGDR